ncbi:Methyltransferase type 11 [Hyella patelloides LEGE 07179]|uniref:Methyltransferase type 11 n=1 Tax=Hyella patelloides LEGE 07179 TaxID=945734 RepID=A0A563VXV8_9CYAN|nr:class I SAM-dependent methyltransferase [Hyella patelloides]VEP16288.1 Methyltransferase type 11 [Hyella patelloides LEGE 07179]
MNEIANWYKKDLAYIHDVGFSDFAIKSAPGIIEILQKHNITEGLIVDLGCGSGLSAQEFIKANYQVLGIDISRSMIEIARNRIPEAEFRVKSLFQAEIPPCNAVTSIGECLNYLFDEENNSQILTVLFERIYKSLILGGVFIFDILEPLATGITQGFKEGEDWIVLFEKEEDREQKKLTRRIITLRKEGSYYKRDDEIHHVRLYESS